MVLRLIPDKTFIIVINLNIVQKKTLITLKDAWVTFVTDPGLFVGGVAFEYFYLQFL